MSEHRPAGVICRMRPHFWLSSWRSRREALLRSPGVEPRISAISRRQLRRGGDSSRSRSEPAGRGELLDEVMQRFGVRLPDRHARAGDIAREATTISATRQPSRAPAISAIASPTRLPRHARAACSSRATISRRRDIRRSSWRMTTPLLSVRDLHVDFRQGDSDGARRARRVLRHRREGDGGAGRRIRLGQVGDGAVGAEAPALPAGASSRPARSASRARSCSAPTRRRCARCAATRSP